MKNYANKSPLTRRILSGTVGIGLSLVLWNCTQGESPSPAGVPDRESQVTLPAETPTLLSEVEAAALGKKSAAATYLHFGDRTACQWNPGICGAYAWAHWPGYIQNAGGSDWIYAWQSRGPWTAPVGNLAPSMDNPHFHINGLAYPAREPNPQHTAMRGNWWTWIAVKRGNARVNFDLTQINVTGSPVWIGFKAAIGQGYEWRNLGRGRWNLPGATNIQEVHISSASQQSGDAFTMDDLLITPR
jgi:hypothetical protein